MLGNLGIGSINGVGFMPVNLVINPEFNVNQRGAASPTATTGYNYDRWYYDGTNLLQGIENLNLSATTYVVSWSGSATCSYSLNTAASSSQGGQSYTSISNGGTLTIASLGSNNLWLKFSGTLTGLTKVMCVPSPAQTPFIARQYPQELALCQRYYFKHKASDGNATLGTGFIIDTNTGLFCRYFPVTMRTAPTSIEQSGTASDYRIRYSNTNTNCNGVPSFSTASDNECTYSATVASGTTNGTGAFLRSVNSNAYLAWSAEL